MTTILLIGLAVAVVIAAFVGLCVFCNWVFDMATFHPWRAAFIVWAALTAIASVLYVLA